MTELVAACAIFLGWHLGVSGSPLRGRIVEKIGETAFLGMFALGALAAFVWICLSYGPAYGGADNLFLFDPGQAYRNLALGVVGLAFFIAVPGILMLNPTSAGQEKASIRGVQRITRHPFLWGTILWAGFHLGGAGDLASTVLFATFLILALFGTILIDAKCRRRLGPQAWRTLTAQSSNLPFAAIVAGRTHFVWREYFDWRLAVAAANFAIFLYFHAALFGLSPYPNGWMP